ncbi:DnaJ-class molecular chaperone CbpA [Labilithrix luteola]|uniref:DnaJ-class molecular chaperone CbpA n=1 Tax=Labilithrix luteola TaxID=1391654 RepID=A0A0K1QFQ5_9BACT|nr:J domain-containing protein [Labilithrix luteola]AKV04245.1 DnaJ-class molecular chaperone CbpA [Labilithrix luteola]
MVDAPKRPAPSATGTLATTPLAHVLVYARNRRLTGLFELRAPNGDRGDIAFWRGRITDVRNKPPVAYFGAVLYELGHIDIETMNATLLEVAQKRRKHGDILVERGAITKAQRDEALFEQLCRKTQHLFTFPKESEFTFYEATPNEGEPPIVIDPLAPVWRGLREHPTDPVVAEVLARFRASGLRLISDAPLTSVGLGPEETKLCKAMADKPMTIIQMRAMSSLEPQHLDLLLYLLVIGKCVEVASVSTPSMPAASAGRPSSGVMASVRPPMASIPIVNTPESTVIPQGIMTPPSSRSPMKSMPSMSFRVGSTPGMPAVGSTRPMAGSMPPPVAQAQTPAQAPGPLDLGMAKIIERAQNVDAEDYFTALGVPEGASVEAVRAAYFRLAKLWHPDRIPPQLEGVRREIEKIFSHMTNANGTLTDTEARRGWLASRAASKQIVKPPRKDVIREIDSALQRRDYAYAQEEARMLAESDAEDLEAQALLAWAMAWAGDAAPEVLTSAIAALDKAVHKDRYCERAYFYRGMLHKRLGNTATAARDFARTVQINPKHVDAAREVRLFEMRARKSGSGEHMLGFGKNKAKKS